MPTPATQFYVVADSQERTALEELFDLDIKRYPELEPAKEEFTCMSEYGCSIWKISIEKVIL